MAAIYQQEGLPITGRGHCLVLDEEGRLPAAVARAVLPVSLLAGCVEMIMVHLNRLQATQPKSQAQFALAERRAMFSLLSFTASD